MKYHNKKVRSAVTDTDELEILLLKQSIQVALQSGCFVRYRERYMVYSYDEGYIVNKLPAENAYVSFKGTQLTAAVDSFVDMFINEDMCNLNQVIFDAPSGAGVQWSTVRRNASLEDLLDHNHFAIRLSLLTYEFRHENANVSPKDSHHDSE